MENSFDTIRWFKEKAKELLKGYRSGDDSAVALLLRYRLDLSCKVGLQNVQHALARQAGFKNWNALIAVSDLQRQEAVSRFPW